MRLSCIPICLFKELCSERTMTVEAWIEMAADLGLDGIEMYEPYLDSFEPSYLAEVAAELKSHGLAVSMYTGYGDLANPEHAGFRDAVQMVKRNVDLALAFDSKIVRAVAGQWHEGATREQTLERVAQGLRECLEYAREKAVWLAFEDHPDVGTKIEDFVEIIERVGSPDLKVNLDTSNPMVSGQSAVDLAELVKDRVVHVHASDRFADLAHSVAGEGAADFPTIFSILKRAGFDGWVSMEAGGDRGKEGIRDGLTYLKRIWEAAGPVA